MTVSQSELEEHLALVEYGDQATSGISTDPLIEQTKTTPLFSSAVRARLASVSASGKDGQTGLLPQYGLLGKRTALYRRDEEEPDTEVGDIRDNLIYANINAPWSTFICGSQGSGKSHTLSCMLENSLLYPSKTGRVSSPLTGLVLHYDKFSGFETGQLCEAAYLCSAGIPVRVLVSPSNYDSMKDLYSNLPGLPKDCPRPIVEELKFQEDHLSIAMMKSLMAVGDSTSTPLYMEMVVRVLRDMAKERQGKRGIDFNEFKKRVTSDLVKGQSAPLQMRLDLLESFLDVKPKPGQSKRPKTAESDVWNFKRGSLTIIDLSCPFVDENSACALFNICLGIFLERRGDGGRVIALDEAHKFLTTTSSEAAGLTATMLSLIRQQRHLATRVIIATQEPTLSPSLLDLCNVTIVHRFTSPAWFQVLKKHLAGAVTVGSKYEQSQYSAGSIFSRIVKLNTGEALVFCPGAILDLGFQKGENGHADSESSFEEGEIQETSSPPSTRNAIFLQELGEAFFKLKVRKRVTTDGGRSIMAE